MLVSHRKRFIYTKTFKTAGTSVELYFEPWCLPEGEWSFSHHRDAIETPAGIIGYRGRAARRQGTWFGHMSAKDIKDRIGDTVWNSYFKFCVVRNPFDKLISAFFWKQRQRAKHPVSALTSKLRRRLKGCPTPFDRIRGNNDIERFRSWIAAGGGASTDRDKYVLDGQICMDYFIRYESLEQGIRDVSERLDIPFDPKRIPALKQGVRPTRNLKDYYDKPTVERVMELYALEIQTFGYTPPV